MPEWLKALWQALVYLVIAAIVLFLGRLVYRIIRKVELPQAEVADAEWERMKAERLAEAVDTGLARIDSGTATDAVIACWVALEEAAASAGRGPGSVGDPGRVHRPGPGRRRDLRAAAGPAR